MNRIRSKSLNDQAWSSFSGSLQTTSYEPNHSPTSWSGSAVVSYPSGFGRIGYEVMHDCVGPIIRDNAVVHYRLEREFSLCPMYHPGGHWNTVGSWTIYPDTNFGRRNIYSHLGSVPTFDLALASVDGIIPNWVSRNDALEVQLLYKRARKPVVEGLVNVIEAKQIPSSLVSLGNALPFKAKTYAGFQRALKRNRLSRRLSSAYIAYQFGIAPLLRDVTSSASFLSDFAKSLDRFERGDSMHQSSIYMGSFTNYHQAAVPDPDVYYLDQFIGSGVPVTRYTLTYRYKKFLPDFLSKLDFLARKFGLTDPAEIIWELIPFSFVVDWFIDVSGILMAIDDKMGLDPIETISCCKSNYWSGQMSHMLVVEGKGTSVPAASVANACTTSYSYYARSALGRSTYVGPSVRFGKKQALISLALARSRLRR